MSEFEKSNNNFYKTLYKNRKDVLKNCADVIKTTHPFVTFYEKYQNAVNEYYFIKDTMEKMLNSTSISRESFELIKNLKDTMDDVCESNEFEKTEKCRACDFDIDEFLENIMYNDELFGEYDDEMRDNYDFENMERVDDVKNSDSEAFDGLLRELVNDYVDDFDEDE